MFIFLNTDLKIDQPQSTVVIDRDKAAAARPQDERRRRRACLDAGRRLRQLLRARRPFLQGDPAGPAALAPQHRPGPRLSTSAPPTARRCRSSTIAKIVTKTIPESLNHFQQLNSATIQGVAFPGVAQDDALNYLQGLATRTLPQGYSVDYGGPSRQYVQESGGFVVTFGFALIIIFLALAALFESFRDPLIILVSVPMSIAGALSSSALGTFGGRHAEHLHPGRPRDADGPDQQARHPDRRVRQRAADAGQVEARGHRGGGRHPACGRS